MKPTVGRIVHYRRASTDPDWNNTGDDPVAAVIVSVFTDECVNLRLLVDGEETPWVTSVCYSEDPKPFSWSWPPRV